MKGTSDELWLERRRRLDSIGSISNCGEYVTIHHAPKRQSNGVAREFCSRDRSEEKRKNGTTGPGRRRRWPWRRTGPRGEKVVNQKQLDLVSLFFSVFYFTDTTICLVNLGIVGRPPLNKSLSAQWSFWCCRAKNWSSGASQPVVLFVVFFLLKKRKKMPPNPKWMAPCRHIKFYKHTHTARRRRRTLS